MDDKTPDPRNSGNARQQRHGVPPEETPPAEGGTSFTGPDESHNPTTGWVKGPMAALAIVVALFCAFFVCYALWLLLT